MPDFAFIPTKLHLGFGLFVHAHKIEISILSSIIKIFVTLKHLPFISSSKLTEILNTMGLRNQWYLPVDINNQYSLGVIDILIINPPNSAKSNSPCNPQG